MVRLYWKHGWFIYVYVETPIKMDGCTPILGNLHVAILKGGMSHIESSPSLSKSISKCRRSPRDPHKHSIRFVDDRKSHLIQPSDGHGEATKMFFFSSGDITGDFWKHGG
jgi:hypothetical protein